MLGIGLVSLEVIILVSIENTRYWKLGLESSCEFPGLKLDFLF